MNENNITTTRGIELERAREAKGLERAGVGGVGGLTGRWLRGLRTAFLCLALALGSAPALAQEEEDEAALLERLKGLVDEVSGTAISRLSELREAEELTPEAARKVIQEAASPHFDFAGLARGALGKHWRKADEAERVRVAELFRGVLEKTYAKALSTYAGQAAKTTGASSLSEKKKAVEVEVGAGGKSARIDYIFSPDAEGEWRVSDVKVEGVSLLASYRRQFSGIIRKGGVSGLIEKLEERAQ